MGFDLIRVNSDAFLQHLQGIVYKALMDTFSAQQKEDIRPFGSKLASAHQNLDCLVRVFTLHIHYGKLIQRFYGIAPNRKGLQERVFRFRVLLEMGVSLAQIVQQLETLWFSQTGALQMFCGLRILFPFEKECAERKVDLGVGGIQRNKLVSR